MDDYRPRIERRRDFGEEIEKEGIHGEGFADFRGKSPLYVLWNGYYARFSVDRVKCPSQNLSCKDTG